VSELPIQLVCFDVGGVMIRICRSWAEGCRAAGVPVRDEAHYLASRTARHEIVARHQVGLLDGSAFADALSAAMGGLYSPAEVLAVHRAWLLEPYEGLPGIIDSLHALGIHTAALSNTNHEHWRRMDEYPAVGRLRHRFTSHELGLAKPDAAIFRKVESHTGARGRQILFFDDLEENIAAARSAGWRAELIDPLRETAPQISEALFVHVHNDIDRAIPKDVSSATRLPGAPAPRLSEPS
jgi:putative hydrolase of the HAD superfamily